MVVQVTVQGSRRQKFRETCPKWVQTLRGNVVKWRIKVEESVDFTFGRSLDEEFIARDRRTISRRITLNSPVQDQFAVNSPSAVKDVITSILPIPRPPRHVNDSSQRVELHPSEHLQSSQSMAPLLASLDYHYRRLQRSNRCGIDGNIVRRVSSSVLSWMKEASLAIRSMIQNSNLKNTGIPEKSFNGHRLQSRSIQHASGRTTV